MDCIQGCYRQQQKPARLCGLLTWGAMCGAVAMVLVVVVVVAVSIIENNISIVQEEKNVPEAPDYVGILI